MADDAESEVMEITPQMIEAGVSQLREDFVIGCDLSLLVERIYIAMALQAQRPS